MKTNATWLSFVLTVAVLGWISYAVGTNVAGHTVQASQRKVRFYQDSMHPWVRSDQPGKCTICGMDLTPIYEGDKEFAADNNLVVLSSNAITVLNVQAEPVKRQPLSRTLRVAGTLAANESRRAIVSAPARGRIDSLPVEYAGVEVEQGQKLLTLFSPELQQQSRYLFAGQSPNQIGPTNSTGHGPSARFELDPSSGASRYSSDLLAPRSGVVVERNVSQGQYVAEGERLFTIVDASVLWFRFDVYEQQLSWLKPGQAIEVSVAAVPGKTFPAVISFIDPSLDEATRTVKVRADIQNPLVSADGQTQRWLRFGMYAEGRVRAEARDSLVVPRTAVLFPGRAAYAYVDKGNGVYERRRLKLGREGDGQWEVLQGLEAGDRVVTSGNVLIDAQAQFNQGNQSDLAGTDDAGPATPPTMDAAPVEVVPAPSVAVADKAPTQASAVQSPRNAGNSRRTRGAGMRDMRMDTIAEANGQKSAPAAPPPAALPAETPAMAAGAAPSDPASQVTEGQSAEPGRYPATPDRNRNVARGADRDVMQRLRWTLMTQAQAQSAADGAPSTALPPQPNPSAASTPLARPMPGRDATPSYANRFVNYRQADAALRATSAEMRQMRLAAIAEARNGTDVKPGAPNPEGSSLGIYIALADRITQALAADDVIKVNQCITNLPAASAGLQKESGADPRWGSLVQKLVAASTWHAAVDLADARKQFLPFSTAAVELAKELRKTEPMFSGLKIYHCPMAPKPGLWMQAKGPLRNPFYGSKMLTCGEEVAQ